MHVHFRSKITPALARSFLQPCWSRCQDEPAWSSTPFTFQAASVAASSRLTSFSNASTTVATMASSAVAGANSSSRDLDLAKRLVWIDCEMTGLDPEKETLLEVAVLVTDADLNVVAEGPDLVIHQPDSVLDAMGSWCTKQHGDSGLTNAVKGSDLDMATAESRILSFLKEHVPAGKCPLAGNSVGQDARFLNKYMPKLMSHLHYRVVDVSTIKELARRWRPDVLVKAPAKSMTHRALDDIRESVKELQFYRKHFFNLNAD